MLLRAGAREVVAVDVGYGQLAWSLQSDERVQVHDRTNIRELTLDVIGDPVDLVVGDLSFISLALVLDPLLSVTRSDGELALMVKPQFEVGKERVGKGGVVRDLGLRAEAVTTIADLAAAARVGRRRRDDQPAARAVGQRRVLPAAAPRSGSDRRRRHRARRWSAPPHWGWRVRGWTRDAPRAPYAACWCWPTPDGRRYVTSLVPACSS